MTSRRRFKIDPWLLGLMVSGLLLRVGVAWWLHSNHVTRGDEGVYLSLARDFSKTGVLETGELVRPPLYFVLLAGIRLLSEPFQFGLTFSVKIVQCLVSVATLALVGC